LAGWSTPQTLGWIWGRGCWAGKTCKRKEMKGRMGKGKERRERKDITDILALLFFHFKPCLEMSCIIFMVISKYIVYLVLHAYTLM